MAALANRRAEPGAALGYARHASDFGRVIDYSFRTYADPAG
jgi:hypothetical protein